MDPRFYSNLSNFSNICCSMMDTESTKVPLRCFHTDTRLRLRRPLKMARMELYGGVQIAPRHIGYFTVAILSVWVLVSFSVKTPLP